ncbi:hypothetical protein TWF106_000534 [Orbilia oligospora]|uniref:Uncharacterized protein n=1 Tax=Orbilia oligospora TaxID=2813651 RepID=A0A7C8UJN6_ORBOL|nr:hypothetical protein TWF106_000534 [Orbilia oligospora]
MSYHWQTDESSETDGQPDLEDRGCEDIQTSTKLSETEITKLLMERNDLEKEVNILKIENNNWKIRSNNLRTEKNDLKTEKKHLLNEIHDLRVEIACLMTESDRPEAEKREHSKLGFWNPQRQSFHNLAPEARKQKKEAYFAESVGGELAQPTSSAESATENTAEAAIDNPTQFAAENTPVYRSQ